MKRLLVYTVRTNLDIALYTAAENGHSGIMKLLLDARSYSIAGLALKTATTNGHTAVVDLFLSNLGISKFVDSYEAYIALRAAR